MIDIKSMTPEELTAEIAHLGEPAFRAKQIFKWLHKGVRGFDEMTDLSAALRSRLKEVFVLKPPEAAEKQVSSDGTAKILWRLIDGECVESVVMLYKHGATVCVSSQAGCRMGCKFCASALGGLIRNLTAGEILDQVIFSGKETGQRMSNIVLMGIGEPLDNYDNVLRFVELVTHPGGLNIGARRISLSTCGIIEKVDKLGYNQLQLTLSVSLHAPDDETRSKIMPVNAKYNIAALMESCRRYFKTTGRRVTFEYALIGGVNDSPEHAKRLVKLLGGEPWHVNLIPLNGVPERGLPASGKADTAKFAEILRVNNVNYTFRRRLGIDIGAACGQLRRREVIDKEEDKNVVFRIDRQRQD